MLTRLKPGLATTRSLHSDMASVVPWEQLKSRRKRLDESAVRSLAQRQRKLAVGTSIAGMLAYIGRLQLVLLIAAGRYHVEV